MCVAFVCSAPVIGFKALPSGDVATSPWSIAKKRKADKVSGKAVSSGQYTFYQDKNALEIGKYKQDGSLWAYNGLSVVNDLDEYGGQKLAANRASFTKWQDCLNACDDDYL